MAFIQDNRAVLIDVVQGTSKTGKPFKIAKIALSGTGSVSSCFVSDDCPALPPVLTPFSIHAPVVADRNGGLALGLNKDCKIAKAE